MPLPFLYSVTAALDGWWRPDGMRRRRNSHWTADGADGWLTPPTGPPQTRNPPPASRALWETAQLGKRRRGTPRQIPGHFAFAPCPQAGAGGGLRRVAAGADGPLPDTEPPARFRGT